MCIYRIYKVLTFNSKSAFSNGFGRIMTLKSGVMMLKIYCLTLLRLLCFGSNKCRLVEQKRLLSKHKKNLTVQKLWSGSVQPEVNLFKCPLSANK